jgi:small subunit ribosomal protein S2
MPVATRRELLEAGVHFGHQTRRWNPKMGRFLYGERGGIYIIDLEKTLTGLEEAYDFVRELGRQGGSVLFVGTKKQAQEVVAGHAGRVGMPFVNTRWLGGMLTNFSTIARRLARLRELREMERGGAFEYLPKKEVLKLRHEKEKLERNLGGMQDLERLPDAIFVIDTKKEHIAVTEARKLKLPVIAIVDTNCDPDEVDYVIPGNDDAIRAVTLISRVIADALEEGRLERYQGAGVRASREPEIQPEPEAAPAPAEATPAPARQRAPRARAAASVSTEAPAAEAPAAEAPAAATAEASTPEPSEAVAVPTEPAAQPAPAAATDADEAVVTASASAPEAEQAIAGGPAPVEEAAAAQEVPAAPPADDASVAADGSPTPLPTATADATPPATEGDATGTEDAAPAEDAKEQA